VYARADDAGRLNTGRDFFIKTTLKNAAEGPECPHISVIAMRAKTMDAAQRRGIF
jgi:hypothetical protein